MTKEQKDFHKSRRTEFSRLIGKDSIAIIFGNTLHNKSFDGDYDFNQYKNFFYLTGFTQPNAALVLAPGGIKSLKNKKTYSEILHVQKRDPRLETWNGRRLGYEDVNKELGINDAKENHELKSILNSRFLWRFSKVYINFSEMIKLEGEMKEIISDFMNSLNIISAGVELIDCSYLLGKIRKVKTSFEIKQIQKACDITIESYNHTMTMIRPDLNERQVQAILEFNYKFNGSKSTAYYPIVAGGENACILHYENNDQDLKDGELLLIDSGAEYNYYCSDITRTFPINGKFSPEQKLIYEIVLKANKECIKKIKPGVSYLSLKDLSEKILADGLSKIGLLKNKSDIKTFSLHGLGHDIGLDTHDAVPTSKTLSKDYDKLMEGNVLTIEPGLYFPVNSKGIPKKFWGIGVRIEDDVLVTRTGSRNLTEKMVKEVNDVEKIMGR
ncbi:MAG: aminopeptidase P family protein [bacterium]